MTRPLLSIVIANYNYGRFLEEAIKSVLSQSCQDFELIICDANSKDNSLSIIRNYAHRIKWWCSEPDAGQSAAFNKGFSHADGRFLTWLNADDVMLPGTIEKLKVCVKAHPKCEWFVGGVFWLDPEMRIVNMGRGRPFSLVRYMTGDVNVWGPSSFFTKRLLNSVGGVDERFQYSMDSDLWLRFAYKAGARYRPFCDYAWGLRLHPDAKMSRHNFTAEGKLNFGVQSELDDKQKKAEAQKRREEMWRSEYFPRQSMGRIAHIISVSWFKVAAAKIDLLRFRGKHYMEYFK